MAPIFLTGEELGVAEVSDLLSQSQQLKAERHSAARKDLFGQTYALIFDKPSLRTRASFTIAITELGGQALEISSSERKREEPEDTMRVLNGFVHGVMIRTFAQSTLERMAKHSRVPLINGLSDLHHPCQALADLLTIRESLGGVKPRRRPRLTYLGDGNNVLHSLLLLAPLEDIDITYSCPKGFDPDAVVVRRAQSRIKSLGLSASIRSVRDPIAATRGADFVYTDVWTSMGFEPDSEEQETVREQVFAPYQLSQDLINRANEGAPTEELLFRNGPKVMHCMPLIRGKEITHDLVEGANSLLFQQAENRLHAQKALLIWMNRKGEWQS
jgi:ornithine carbamoyltransferase